jgi:hypothetical protein
MRAISLNSGRPAACFCFRKGSATGSIITRASRSFQRHRPESDQQRYLKKEMMGPKPPPAHFYHVYAPDFGE